MAEDTQGNPKAVDNAVFGSSEDFFTALENDVNSGIVDKDVQSNTNETTSTQSPQSVKNVPNKVSQPQNLDSELNNLKKRYSDSSREAQRMRAQLNELKPFMPVLDAMKKDSGLVNHVRDYVANGGSVPKNIKEQFKLKEDFEFDMDEVVNNPNSDSAKVFNAMVDKAATQKVNQYAAVEKQKNAEANYKTNLKKSAFDFMKRRGLTPSEFKNFIAETKQKLNTQGMTFDDMYMIMNKGKVNQNVANATKTDMLNQMKNVRELPTSQGAANNSGEVKSQNDNVFDALLNSDGNIEELLG